ncbi:MAG TPA: hypothetical protein VFV86_08550 [Nitrososphaeraceae archaeon]|nr:hypothetical protein [Nitrososphaeraceae archaeon]
MSINYDGSDDSTGVDPDRVVKGESHSENENGPSSLSDSEILDQ